MSKSARLATTLVFLVGTTMATVAPTGALARTQTNGDRQGLDDSTGPTSGTTSQPLAHSE